MCENVSFYFAFTIFLTKKLKLTSLNGKLKVFRNTTSPPELRRLSLKKDV